MLGFAKEWLQPGMHPATLPQGAQGKCAAVCKSRWEKKKERDTNSIVAISAQEGPLGADPERIVTIQLYRQKRHCFSN